MKKINYFAIIIVLCGTFKSVFGQTPYYDALKLKSYLLANANGTQFDSSKKGEVDAILANPQYIGGIAHQTVKSAYQNNPFIYPYLPNSWTSDNHELAFVANDEAGEDNFVGNVGAFNVTNIANGIASLLIDRAKQELTIAFFNRFKNLINDPNHQEFKTLFPKTCDNLNTLLSYSYTQWLPALRTGFYADLQNIPGKFNDLLKLPDVESLLKNLPEIAVALRTVALVEKIKNGKESIADGLKDFATFQEISDNNKYKDGFKNFANSIKLIAIFSEALRNSNEEQTSESWIDAKQLGSLVGDPITFKIFLGLIFQETVTEQIKFYKNNQAEDFSNLFDNSDATISKVQDILQNFISIANEVDQLKNDLQDRKANHVSLSNDDYYNYINSALNVIEYGFDIGRQFDANLDATIYVGIAKKADEVYRNLYKEQYPQAITNVVYILNQSIDLIQKDALKKSNKALLKIQNPDANTLQEIAKNNQLIDAKGTISNVSGVIATYGLLIANIVEAKSSADVEAAINSAILPVGSYTIKQNSYFNIALNGYIGYAWTFNSFPFQKYYSGGIYAPIGFTFSGDIKGGAIKKLPLTLFISVIDVGSIVSYQLSNSSTTGTTTTNGSTPTTATVNTTAMNQQIKLSSIFSPSAQAFYEFPGLPFAIGGGWRRTPTLSYSSGSSYSVVGAKSVCNFTILIDIPFFNFYNNPRNQK